MNVLVTGGTGFIGTNLILKLIEDGHNITSVDNYYSGKVSNHHPNVNYINGHTKDIFDLLKGKQFDVVFHLGEHSKIVPSFNEISEMWESNSEGTFKVIEYCKQNKIKLVYAGSSTKFAKEGPNHSPYAFVKSRNCDLIKCYGEWFGLQYAICYFYNVFGPYQDTCNNGYETVISIFEKQYKSNAPITVCGTGEQTRSFTYVKDIVDGLIKSWKYDKNEEFQLNNKNVYSILSIAKMFTNNIQFVKMRLGDRKEGSIDCEKSRHLLKWETTKNVDEWIDEIKKI